MTTKTQFKVYAAIGDGMAWCVDTFDNLPAAKRCADQQGGAAYVKEVSTKTVYRNSRRSPDKVRFARDVLERARPPE